MEGIDFSIPLIHFALFFSRRAHCNQGSGDHPLYVNVDMVSGAIHTSWIDSLQAAFAGVQVNNQDEWTMEMLILCVIHCLAVIKNYSLIFTY